MKKVIIFSIAIFAAAFNQNSFANSALTPNKPLALAINQPNKTETLPAGTMVYLELAEQLRSQKMTVGRIVKFTVKMNVKVGGDVFVRSGTLAVGRIKSIERNSYNDPEEVNIEITSVQAVDGTMVDLNGTEAIFLGDNSGEEATIASLPQMIARVMNDIDIEVK
jgi:hypothetical protein